MLEGLRHLISLERPITEILRDLIDILVVAFIVYRALLVMKGTRAMQMGIGFVAFGLLYLGAKYMALATLMSVLSWLASSAILILVVVFQNDIRRALIRLGSKAWLTRGHDAQEKLIEEVVAACTELARHRMGAIICIERDANVLEFVKNDGIELDSTVTRELLVSLFIPEAVNKTHDGAVLIRNLRMARAGLFFPMPESTKISDPNFGSRHRAAIGITEETDAIVIVTSEERGSITLFFNTNMVRNLNGQSLRDALKGLFRGEDTAGRSPVSLRRGSILPESARLAPESRRVETVRDKPTEKRASPKPSITKPPAASSGRSEKDNPKEKRDPRASGAFNLEELAEAAVSEMPRLSVPMPSSKDSRRLAEDRAKPPEDDDSAPPPAASPTVSKPMTPTELPRTSSFPSDDS